MIQELRIKLNSYDHRLLDQSVKKIIEIVKANGSQFAGPIPLPVKKEVFTVIRSPHVNKDSREQFERRTHKRLIIVKSPNEKTIDNLKRIVIPTGVNIEILV